jgi:hypothetical protein
MPEPLQLNPDYRDMITLLKTHNAEYLVVGAYAMAAHGYLRATSDIDIWVNPTQANAQKVFVAVRDFGAPLIDVTVATFSQDDAIIQLGVAPNRIDIITTIDGVDFPSAWDAHVIRDLDGVTLPVLSIPDLIRNKSSTGREKDLLDVAKLKRLLKP